MKDKQKNRKRVIRKLRQQQAAEIETHRNVEKICNLCDRQGKQYCLSCWDNEYFVEKL